MTLSAKVLAGMPRTFADELSLKARRRMTSFQRKFWPECPMLKTSRACCETRTRRALPGGTSLMGDQMLVLLRMAQLAYFRGRLGTL